MRHLVFVACLGLLALPVAAESACSDRSFEGRDYTVCEVTAAEDLRLFQIAPDGKPFGTFERKYFFGSALGTETGGNASSTAVRALIKQFVSAEDTAKPLSDNQISDMLREQGIECARRTVAKYREALRIAPANLRKR